MDGQVERPLQLFGNCERVTHPTNQQPRFSNCVRGSCYPCLFPALKKVKILDLVSVTFVRYQIPFLDSQVDILPSNPEFVG